MLFSQTFIHQLPTLVAQRKIVGPGSVGAYTRRGGPTTFAADTLSAYPDVFARRFGWIIWPEAFWVVCVSAPMTLKKKKNQRRKAG